MRLRRCNFLPLLFSLLMALFVTASAAADSPALPSTYTKPSADGRFVFVMLSSRPEELIPRRSTQASFPEDPRAIRLKYAQSGLYPNDGSTTPLWTVNWYSFDVDVASDGVHLVRHGPWASRTSDEALSYFANGKLIRTYRISKLVDAEFLLSHSVSHFMWARDIGLDDAKLRASVSTYDGNSFVFDITTGQIIEQRRYAKWWVCLLVVFFATCVGSFSYLSYKSYRFWAEGRLRLPTRVVRVGIVLFCGWLLVINGPLMFLTALSPSRSHSGIDWLVGAILNVAIGLLGVRSVLRAELRDRRAKRRAAGRCEACGYDLRATPTACPECGQVV